NPREIFPPRKSTSDSAVSVADPLRRTSGKPDRSPIRSAGRRENRIGHRSAPPGVGKTGSVADPLRRTSGKPDRSPIPSGGERGDEERSPRQPGVGTGAG